MKRDAIHAWRASPATITAHITRQPQCRGKTTSQHKRCSDCSTICCPAYLMPCNHAAVVRRLAEQLVVPEAGAAAQQLRGCPCNTWSPEHVVEGGGDAPCAQRVKHDLGRIGALVAVVLVPEGGGGGMVVRKCSGIAVSKRARVAVAHHRLSRPPSATSASSSRRSKLT
jgi:hypothetical protein